MITKVCPNLRCVAYARMIYTGATRCEFCKWDLKAAHRGIGPEMHAAHAGLGVTRLSTAAPVKHGGEGGIRTPDTR